MAIIIRKLKQINADEEERKSSCRYLSDNARTVQQDTNQKCPCSLISKHLYTPVGNSILTFKPKYY